MIKIKESSRIKEIENKWNDSIENLLYKWHWKDNLMHKEIGKKLNIPRSTITRWFHQLEIPSQDSHRITKLNLLNVGPRKGPRAKPKIKSNPRFSVNREFFKRWSPEMAYVLGYFVADGCMFINPRGSHYIEFTSTDKELIEKVRKLMESNHSIGIFKSSNPHWKTKYRLQIGSKEMFKDLLKLNLIPCKSKSIKLPNISRKYFADFVHGYFDGDGCVILVTYSRKNRKSLQKILTTRFTSGSQIFLRDLWKLLQKYAKLNGGGLRKKKGGFELTFGIYDNLKLFKFMYKNVSSNQFLERKYQIFQEAFNYWGRRSIGQIVTLSQ